MAINNLFWLLIDLIKMEQLRLLKSKMKHYYDYKNLKDYKVILWIFLVKNFDNLNRMGKLLEINNQPKSNHEKYE